MRTVNKKVSLIFGLICSATMISGIANGQDVKGKASDKCPCTYDLNAMKTVKTNTSKEKDYLEMCLSGKIKVASKNLANESPKGASVMLGTGIDTNAGKNLMFQAYWISDQKGGLCDVIKD